MADQHDISRRICLGNGRKGGGCPRHKIGETLALRRPITGRVSQKAA